MHGTTGIAQRYTAVLSIYPHGVEWMCKVKSHERSERPREDK